MKFYPELAALLGEEIIQKYAAREIKKAKRKVEKESHGEGCGCLNCLKSAVNDINYWLDVLDPERKMMRYDLSIKGQNYEIVVILSPDS